MKTKKRYTMASQIIADIDKCHALADKLPKEAEALDIEADNFFKHEEMVETAKLRRLQAAKVRLRANNLRNKKAKKLGGKLAEINTGTMTILPDGSIPV